jgi:hypothetical protein
MTPLSDRQVPEQPFAGIGRAARHSRTRDQDL